MINFFENQWLKHPRIWVTIFVVGTLITVAGWFTNRETPTKIPDLNYAMPVVAGKMLNIDIPVDRSLKRRCSVRTNRTVIDANHTSVDTVVNKYVSAESLAMREAETPGRLVLGVPIDANMVPGPAKVITDNLYTCLYNPLTYLWPIEDTWVVSFTVLPKS